MLQRRRASSVLCFIINRTQLVTIISQFQDCSVHENVRHTTEMRRIEALLVFDFRLLTLFPRLEVWNPLVIFKLCKSNIYRIQTLQIQWSQLLTKIRKIETSSLLSLSDMIKLILKNFIVTLKANHNTCLESSQTEATRFVRTRNAPRSSDPFEDFLATGSGTSAAYNDFNQNQSFENRDESIKCFIQS